MSQKSIRHTKWEVKEGDKCKRVTYRSARTTATTTDHDIIISICCRFVVNRRHPYDLLWGICESPWDLIASEMIHSMDSRWETTCNQNPYRVQELTWTRRWAAIFVPEKDLGPVRWQRAEKNEEERAIKNAIKKWRLLMTLSGKLVWILRVGCLVPAYCTPGPPASRNMGYSPSIIFPDQKEKGWLIEPSFF